MQQHLEYTTDKNLHPILEWHAIIIDKPNDWEGIFWFWTHTCSLLIIEWEEGEIGMVHVHERIGSSDLFAFFNEFDNIKKVSIVWWSYKILSLCNKVIEEKEIKNIDYKNSQEDAVIYKKWKENIIKIKPIPYTFVQKKTKEMSHHIKDCLIMMAIEWSKHNKDTISLIIEKK